MISIVRIYTLFQGSIVNFLKVEEDCKKQFITGEGCLYIIISLFESTAGLLIYIGCLSIPDYSNNIFYLISPSNSLSVLPSFIIPGLIFCYSNSPSIICSSHDVHCHCPFFSYNFVQDVFNFSRSLIHDVPFLSLHVMPNIIFSIPLWALWSFSLYHLLLQVIKETL